MTWGQGDGRAEAAARRIRHRQWTSCLRKNGFSDQPLWRAVARRLDLPVFQIVAFVNRLEEQANAVTPRGYVGDFSSSECAAALDMTIIDALRIYDALEHVDIQWISQDQIADFHTRNPDKEDVTAAERMRRMRARRKAARTEALKSLTGNAERDGVTVRNTVTVTPRAEQIFSTGALTEHGQQKAEQGLESGDWLKGDGRRTGQGQNGMVRRENQSKH